MIKSGTNLKRTRSIQVERGSLFDINVESDKQKPISRMASEDSFCSSESKEHWMVESRDRTATVINTLESEEFPKILKRKLTGMGQSDEIPSHPSSVCAEDGSEADQSDLISLQDVLDFPDDDQSYISDVDENDLKDIDDVSEIGLGESAVDYEVVHGDDDLIEPISLTKELKRLGVSVDISSECPSASSSINQTLVDVTEKIDQMSLVKGQINFTQEEGHKSPQSSSRIEPRPLQKRRYPPLGTQKHVSEHVSDLISSGGTSFDADDDGFAFKSIDRSSQRSRDDFIEGKGGERKPLFALDDSESEGTESSLKDEGNKIEEDVHKVHGLAFKPLKGDRQVIKDDGELKSTGFTDGKARGHRRLQSAPVVYTPKKPSPGSQADCGLPGSPFELVKNTSLQDPVRVRSYSQGNNFDDGQEELTKIAERICQVDRKDLEMDDPEEIQVCFVNSCEILR